MVGLPLTTATIKGHMNKTRQGLRSKRAKHNDPDLGYKIDDMNPSQEERSGIEQTFFILLLWLILSRVQFTHTYQVYYQ